MTKAKTKTAKLQLWQDRLSESNAAYSTEAARMDDRERLYGGDRTISPLVLGDTEKNGRFKRTSHVRNIVFENIESQVSSSIPQPKVTPRRKKDERLAEIIEHFLRNELNRLPFETVNDLAERTVPLQGGVGFLVDWDSRQRTHTTVGEICVSLIHPKQLAPQPGVYTGIQDMDWLIVKMPTTKEAVRRRYGVDIDGEGESEPELRGVDGVTPTEDAVTQYIGYARNQRGGIDRYVWVNDVELEDLSNYQARRQPVCARCGRVRPLHGQVISARDAMGPGLSGGNDGEEAERMAAGRAMAAWLSGEAGPSDGGLGALGTVPVVPEEPKPVEYGGGPCPWCGGDAFESREQDFEQVTLPVRTAMGMSIEGAVPGLDENGMPVMRPTMLPFYKPDLFPVVLQKSVSVYGQLWGNSDADMIADQQNTVNRMEQKIIDRLLKAGTRITLPDRADLRTDPEDGERWFIEDPSELSKIKLLEFSGNLEYEMAYLAGVYEESRQILGITDSFQGRKDTTATSGKAKEFSAAQSAGRLESKRIMKNAAYAALFEMMFKFALAYSDEPKGVSYKNFRGEAEYQEFNRYDFLERDENGDYYWNDQFLFSCDTAAPLANNREAMWQETRMNLQSGAFGDPASIETLILFWSKMEELHYPGAAATKAFLEDRLKREKAQAAQQQTMAVQQQAVAVERQAMQDAAAAAGAVTP